MGKIKHQQKEKIFRIISKELAESGFYRTKPTFWVKELKNTIEFIHIHTFSFAYSFRIHLGIRVKNDSFDAIALNGLSSFDGWWQKDKKDGEVRVLKFNELDDSIGSCAKNITDFIELIGLPWFELFEDDNELLHNQNSPLDTNEKTGLLEMINGKAKDENIKLSHDLLRMDKLKAKTSFKK